MSRIPRAMVLVFMERLGYCTWQDFVSQHRTQTGLERRLRLGVKQCEWAAWRLIRIEKEVMGDDS